MKYLASLRRVIPAVATALMISALPGLGAPPAASPSAGKSGGSGGESIEALNRTIDTLQQRRRALVSEAGNLAREQREAVQRVTRDDEGLRELKEQADEARAHAERLDQEFRQLVLQHPDVAELADRRSAIFEEAQEMRIRLRDLIHQRNALRSAANRREYFEQQNQTAEDEGR